MNENISQKVELCVVDKKTRTSLEVEIPEGLGGRIYACFDRNFIPRDLTLLFEAKVTRDSKTLKRSVDTTLYEDIPYNNHEYKEQYGFGWRTRYADDIFMQSVKELIEYVDDKVTNTTDFSPIKYMSYDIICGIQSGEDMFFSNTYDDSLLMSAKKILQRTRARRCCNCCTCS